MSQAAEASLGLWWAWIASWVVAAAWSRRTQARAPRSLQWVHVLTTGLGGSLLLFGLRTRHAWVYGPPGPHRLWTLPASLDWTMTLLVLAGFVFCWWARLTLGDLWSGTITRKENHVIVERGPYRLVRHPIYTGMILSAFALAIQLGFTVNLLGAAIMAGGFWYKAGLEERFLSEQLGPEAYADYRRRTPMLIPFWPKRG
jgi:protein-S-isoprenylcysteine O-methyltransferase Ste14